MIKRLATSPHHPLGITVSSCKNQSVMVSIQYGPFNSNILIKSTTIGKSRVAGDPITMHTYWRSNSDIACVKRPIGGAGLVGTVFRHAIAALALDIYGWGSDLMGKAGLVGIGSES
ncbi:hypothetical protein F511_20664 [Dorcoceras hygrometricum]|uniref:Uncharacterized protein n=1 Tax=Dorcoceras hygrometricum TaxID=472368 RepID=A0A2Z7D4W6_9LAMI|nr:hypothetical protein F511_20664 [Dorcoceras hygrometricum]